MLYHITYRDRYTGKVETGRVSVEPNESASNNVLRSRAISAARFKFPSARRGSISAVRVGPRR